MTFHNLNLIAAVICVLSSMTACSGMNGVAAAGGAALAVKPSEADKQGQSTKAWSTGSPAEDQRLELYGPDSETSRVPLRSVDNVGSNSLEANNIFGLDEIGIGFNIFTGVETHQIYKWTMPSYPQIDPTNPDKSPDYPYPEWTASKYTDRLVPLELLVCSVASSEHDSTTEVFNNADEYFKSEATSLGLSVVAPYVSAAFSLSSSRSKMEKTMQESTMAATSQKHTLYTMKIVPTFGQKCRFDDPDDDGGCTPIIPSSQFTPEFKIALARLPQAIFLPAKQLQDGNLPEGAFDTALFTHFCFENPAVTAPATADDDEEEEEEDDDDASAAATGPAPVNNDLKRGDGISDQRFRSASASVAAGAAPVVSSP